MPHNWGGCRFSAGHTSEFGTSAMDSFQHHLNVAGL